MIKLKYGSLGLLCAALLLPALAAAQDDEGPSYFSVRTFDVKPGHGDQFRELMGQITEAGDAAGWQPRANYMEIRGELGTYYSVTGIENFAMFDEEFEAPMDEGAWENWLAAMRHAGRATSLVVYRTYPRLSIVPPEDAAAPSLIQLRFTRVYPGKNGAFADWVENKLKPALEEGGVQSVNYSRAVIGADTNLWISGMRLENWAALDEPGPLSHLSDDEMEALFEGWGDIVESTNVRMIRYLPDISSPPGE